MPDSFSSSPLPELAEERLPVWLRASFSLWAGVVMAVLVGLVGWGVVRLKQQDLEQHLLGESQLYAQMLADHADRTLDTVDVTLKSLADALQTESRGSMHEALLANAVRALPYLRSISVVDGQGWVLVSSSPGNLGVNLPDAVFQGAQTGGRVQVGAMLLGRDLVDQDQHVRMASVPSNRWFIPMLLKLPSPSLDSGASGSVATWVVAALNPDYFANSHAVFLRDTHRAAALMHVDGTLLSATEPVVLSPGQKALQHLIYQAYLPARELGTFIDAGLDGGPTVAAFRSTRHAPWVVLVELPYEEVLVERRALLQQVALVVTMAWAVIAGLVYLIWRSLRAYRHARIERGRVSRQLHEQAALTGRLLDASPSPLFVVDRQGLLLRVNRACCDLLGWRPSQVMGQSLSTLSPALDEVVQERSQGPKGWPDDTASLLTQGWAMQLPIGTAGVKDVMFYATVFTDGDGQEAGVIGSLVDVSQFREAERRTLEAKQAAESANEAKTEFMANMSHELRTPLQSIIGFSEIGLTRFTEHPKVQLTLQRVHDAGVRMLALVNNLLDLSRTDLLHARMDLQPQPLLPLVQHVLTELQPMADKGAVRLSCQTASAAGDATAHALQAWVDAFAFQQVVRNVVANALRFAPRDSAVTVTLGADPARRQLHLRVQDQGPGIPEAELDAIFQPFVQSSLTKDGSGGTGLGLAICRRILDAHRGSIQARNRPGGGAEFLIVLPWSAEGGAQPVPVQDSAQA